MESSLTLPNQNNWEESVAALNVEIRGLTANVWIQAYVKLNGGGHVDREKHLLLISCKSQLEEC